jgi:hypothetical protein
MLIFSAALRIGSLSLFGAGLSDGRLIPPPPINACIACTAGFGLVRFASSAPIRCWWTVLFASATAAAPVRDTGERRWGIE